MVLVNHNLTHMKKSLLFISAAMLSATTGFSQLGTAHDFTVTDIEGNTHHLYEILDAGYVVVLDASATWCGTCWGVHNQEYLNDLNTQKGPTGTNEIRVIFYEADGSTDMRIYKELETTPKVIGFPAPIIQSLMNTLLH
jgi:hypothetical protein